MVGTLWGFLPSDLDLPVGANSFAQRRLCNRMC